MYKKQVEISLDLAQKCVKCALCKSVCPTYPYIKEEGGFARGRLVLAEMLLKGEISETKEAYKHLDQCAMCRRCEWICPNGVEYKEIIVSARNKQDRSLIKETGLKALDVLQSNVGRKAVKFLGKVMDKLPYKEFRVFFPTGAVKFMPKPDGKAFGLRGKTFKAEQEKGKLLFFTGCMIDAFYSKTGESVVKLMNKAGWTVIVPEDIKCCGAPHYYSGNISAFEKLKEHNLKEMGKYEFDAIVVACPTCGGALQEDYGIDKKVYDFSEIIFESRLNFKGKGEKVTFHVPCHSYSAMKVSEKVFYGVIQRVESDELIKGEKDKSCCGFAGLFSITNPKLSEKIQREKIEDINKTGADVVLTSCPGCVLNLTDGVKTYKTGQKVMHLADYLAEHLEERL
ncbi:(Fe-S)-binding protein [Thermocrinis jamiesonii]|uniref:(Fe-S)-binding protein n=1 Tax=Thermocrinis jamiesonii TaxID=1302351 RepID=UPI000497B2B1|nr:(Fe-S)-binding protein [Thermocrinis jamiesonii]